MTVSGNAQVSDSAQVSGTAQVSGNAQVFGDALVYGNALVSGNARAYGNARVYGNALVSGNAQVSGDAWVFDTRHVFTVGPIGSENQFATVSRHKDGAAADPVCVVGCWEGRLSELMSEAERRGALPQHEAEYRAFVALALARQQEWIAKESSS